MSGCRVLVRVSLLLSLVFAIIQISGCRGVTGASDAAEAKAAGTPQIVFTAAPSMIQAGGSATLTWNITGAVSATIDGIGVIKATSGTMQVTPKTTTSYTLHATGAGGQSQASATVNVDTNQFTFTATPTAITPGSSSTL